MCQPRQPCFKLALNFDYPRLPKALVRTGRSGWYYRVLESGTLRAGDAVEIVERPHPDYPFNALLDLLYSRDLDAVALKRVADTPEIAQDMRNAATEALEAMGSQV